MAAGEGWNTHRDFPVVTFGNMHNIRKATEADNAQLLELWEQSVLATHHFLAADDVVFYRALLKEYLPALEVYVTASEGTISGFIALSENMVQALFVNPGNMNSGIGKALMMFAINEKNVDRVDVNEQNQTAVAFYKRLGFEVVSRQAVDDSGRPYPILKLALPAAGSLATAS
jgi:putative acetyltransferase